MSYDCFISIRFDTGALDPDTGHPVGPKLHVIEEIGNYTSNLSGAWRAAISAEWGFVDTKGLADLSGSRCRQASLILRSAIRYLRDPANREQLLEFEPHNGWGNLEGATVFLEKIAQACEAHPKAWLEVCF